jgi:hypothetical protein
MWIISLVIRYLRALFLREGSCLALSGNFRWTWGSWCFPTLLSSLRWKLFFFFPFYPSSSFSMYINCLYWEISAELVSPSSFSLTLFFLIWERLILTWFYFNCWIHWFVSNILHFGFRRRNGIISKTSWMLLGLWVFLISLYCQKLKLHHIWGLQGPHKAQLLRLRYMSIHWQLMLLNLNCTLDVRRIFSKMPLW